MLLLVQKKKCIIIVPLWEVSIVISKLIHSFNRTVKVEWGPPEWRSGLMHCIVGITTDLGSIPGCVTAGCDRETHEAAHNWPSVAQVKGGFGWLGIPCSIVL